MFLKAAAAAATTAVAAALTGAGSLENRVLIGSVFDTLSYQPQGKRVKATDPSAPTLRETPVGKHAKYRGKRLKVFHVEGDDVHVRK